ncbi:hypothetical protein U1P98_18650 [Lysinibacillus irui]|uniref:DUF3168 domain-containing protein n=1 Tax=Lysinibacillus irui TaxID=2998077 RepID=A0ABU5NQK5_9BACI|nr:hypothetical protein [Lysinibacillus irui]MEA0556076.1 hypothetical protein [Lysinibacillus irui]MEA0978330.1 hypothetical protein [Lysinibacillus irui]MEA1044484.1 hypothetical protein [Lysinibacillus irui]
MTLSELKKKLDALGYPVAYSHFKSKKIPPFICYIADDSETFNADNKPLVEFEYVDIELYTVEKDLLAEGKIKEMLKENKLPWSRSEVFIDTEGVFKCTFSIQLIN